MSGATNNSDWQLGTASSADIDDLMNWFPDQRSCDIWSGPKFRFPFTRESFHEDLLWLERPTYSLYSPTRGFAGFGQIYSRFERINFARLAVQPQLRGRGVGKRLIARLMAVGRELFPLNEYSLYVYRDNLPALRCYQRMGFVIRDYPDGELLADQCYYLTRPVDEERDNAS